MSLRAGVLQGSSEALGSQVGVSAGKKKPADEDAKTLPLFMMAKVKLTFPRPDCDLIVRARQFNEASLRQQLDLNDGHIVVIDDEMAAVRASAALR